ncbi:hypothetical protein EWB00_001993, partial [Schistosoma japonicum]
MSLTGCTFLESNPAPRLAQGRAGAGVGLQTIESGLPDRIRYLSGQNPGLELPIQISTPLRMLECTKA